MATFKCNASVELWVADLEIELNDADIKGKTDDEIQVLVANEVADVFYENANVQTVSVTDIDFVNEDDEDEEDEDDDEYDFDEVEEGE